MWNSEEAGNYLEEIGKSGSILGLTNMRNLMERLGNVQDRLPVVHVAGTNGKGSVCAMLQSVYLEAGYRVGRYTSPAVFSYAERFQVNGACIPKDTFLCLLWQVKEACEALTAAGRPSPTLFEVETAVAFLYFFRENCDVVLLETGMGGAEDATNIIRKPLLSVLTSISMDHMKFLGDTLEQIAAAKAGIIKEEGRAVVQRPSQASVRQVIEEECRRKRAELVYADGSRAEEVRIEGNRLCFSYGKFRNLRLWLLGSYQAANAVCAIEAVTCLNNCLPVTPGQVQRGMEQARWEGRCSIVQQEPLVMLDGAHNEEAAKKLRETLELGFADRNIIYMIGVLADKEYDKMLQIMLPLAVRAYTVSPPGPRALDGELLAKEAGKYHPAVVYVPDIAEAVRLAVWQAKKEQAMVLAFGSLSYLKEVRHALQGVNRKKTAERDETKGNPWAGGWNTRRKAGTHRESGGCGLGTGKGFGRADPLKGPGNGKNFPSV